MPHVGAGADEGASLRAAGLTAICSEPTAVVGCTAQDQGGAKVDSAGAALGEDALSLPLLPSICLPSSHLPSNRLASLLSFPLSVVRPGR